jgi:hypothetical protein
MIFVMPSEDQIHDAFVKYGYKLLYVTDDERWSIAIKSVILGWRAVAYEKKSIGCVVDYCAGDRPIFAIEIAAALKAIFTCLPSNVTNAEINQLLPDWKARPIDKDSCWDQLQALSQKLSATTAKGRA